MNTVSASPVAQSITTAIEVVSKPGCKSEQTIVYEAEDTEVIGLRLPRDMLEHIVAQCEANDVSLDSAIATMLANVRMGDIPLIVKALNPTR